MGRQKSWEKRLAAEPDKLMIDFVESLSFDKRLYKYDIAGSIAHAEMLAEQGIITRADLKDIKEGLRQIEREIGEGLFRFDKTYEDIHMAIEASLIRRIGEPGKKLHTGRSRNDQVAADVRLWMRDQIEVLRSQITGLQKTLVELAARHAHDVMPAYTHMQRAQPIVIAAYVLSFVEQFERDYIRLGNCFDLLNISPLGSGAVAGSTLPLDRVRTAKELGFAGLTANSVDAVSDRDFCAEFIFDCAMISMHLSRLAEDWILFCSNEFGFIRLDDSFCTSSSMMPQKRNPDPLELIRGRTGRAYGALMGILTILKSQPSGYNRDLQEDKVHIFAASDSTSACLDMATGVVGHCSFDTQRIAAGLDGGFLDATALAEYLVARGVAFREAHGIVGTLVAHCENKGCRISDLSLEEMQRHCPAIDPEVYAALGAGNVVERYATAGAGGVEQAVEQIRHWRKVLVAR